MLIYNTKRGFTLLEVMISLSIFSILFLTAVSLQINNIRLKEHNNRLYTSRLYIETVRNRLLYNSDYILLTEIRDGGIGYINKTYLDASRLKEYDISQLLDSFIDSSDSYMKITITGENVLRVELELHELIMGKDEVIICEFFKGSY